jgi:ribosomal protein L11 methyltransferase
MEYLEFKINCAEDFRDIVIAELAEIGFDSFLETDQGMDAYIEETLFDRNLYQEVIEKYQITANLAVIEGKMAKVNWNEEWEKNYDPIFVDDKVHIRASFHAPDPKFPYEIVINPKMSFGTGHHATTYLMISHQMEIAHKDARVLDIGSGTGILAIMAHLLGANEIEAFDTDEWCVENGNENFDLNGMTQVRMGHGTVREVKPQGTFDIVLANINKNVLLDELEVYSTLVRGNGKLLLSGFYEHDVDDLVKKANQHHFQLLQVKTKDQWAALSLERI